MRPSLSLIQFQDEYRQHPGLLPVSLDVERGHVVWMDVGRYHFYEGFFHRSLTRLQALSHARHLPHPRHSLVTDLDALLSDFVVADAIPPTGFIFHAGRCGSTLLAKTLARSRQHLVVSEAAPHNQMISGLTTGWQNPITDTAETRLLYQHLILALGRRRLPSYKAHFVKFSSFTILFFNWIKLIFPTVPALFLFRDPSSILMSYARNPPGWLLPSEPALRSFVSGADPVLSDPAPVEAAHAHEDTGWRSAAPHPPPLYTPDAARLACADAGLRHFFTTALQAESRGLTYCAYHTLTPMALPTLLDFFGVRLPPTEIQLMEAQFRYDAKDDTGHHVLQATPLSPHEHMTNTPIASPQLQQQYKLLTTSPATITLR